MGDQDFLFKVFDSVLSYNVVKSGPLFLLLCIVIYKYQWLYWWMQADKASTLEDAIVYLKDLQNTIVEMKASEDDMVQRCEDLASRCTKLEEQNKELVAILSKDKSAGEVVHLNILNLHSMKSLWLDFVFVCHWLGHDELCKGSCNVEVFTRVVMSYCMCCCATSSLKLSFFNLLHTYFSKDPGWQIL